MTKFTERVEQDLSQIADRATPSSTAWESIQHRIAEQTTQPTMEVIMLNPDQKKPPVVSRTWMAVAAALILVVGIGGLVALLNRDDGGDIDTIDEPEVTVPLELDSEPEVIVPDDTEPETPLVMTGDVVGDCEFGTEDLDLTDLNFTGSQTCVYREADVVPFERIQDYVITTYTDPAFYDAEANPFVTITGLSDSGFMYAGYMVIGDEGNNARIVGAAEGVGPYEGMIIRIVGRSFAADGGEVHMQWVAGDDLSPLTISGTDVEAEEETTNCMITGFVEDNDAHPQTEQFTSECTAEDGTVNVLDTYLFGPAENTLGVGSNRFVVTPGSSITAGIIPREGGPTLTTGIEEGTGDNEGLLLHQLGIGTITAAGDSSGTTVQVALPPTK